MGKLIYVFFGLIILNSISGCSKNENRQLDHSREFSELVNRSPNSTLQGKADSVDKKNASPVTTQFKFTRDNSYGSGEDVLIGVTGPVAVDNEGRVFITDNSQTTIHVFQPDGRYLKSFGGQGRGPGEFMWITPHTALSIRSDRFYITDLADMHFYFPHRMHEFLLEDLSFSRTINLLAQNKGDFDELEGFFPQRVFLLKNDRLLISYQRSPNQYQDAESTIWYVIQDTEGIIVSDPVLNLNDKTNLTVEVTDTEIPYTAIHSFPFYGKSLLAVSDNGHIYTVHDSEKFNIDIYNSLGNHIHNIEHEFENIAFHRNEILDFYEEINYTQQLGEGIALRMIREANNLPETWPAIEEMLIDDENHLWISTIVDDFDIYEWWILEENGELITRFKWPRAEPIEVIKNGYMYTRETDEETGLQQIVRYRVEVTEN